MTLWFYPCEFVAAAATIPSLLLPHSCPDLAIIYLLKFQNLSQNPYRRLHNFKIKPTPFPNTHHPVLPVWSQCWQNNPQLKITLIKVTSRCHSSHFPSTSGPCAGIGGCLWHHPLAGLTHILTNLLIMPFPCFTFQVIPSFTLLPTVEICRQPRLLPCLHSQQTIPGPLTLAPKLLLISLFLFFPLWCHSCANSVHVSRVTREASSLDGWSLQPSLPFFSFLMASFKPNLTPCSLFLEPYISIISQSSKLTLS